MKSISIKILKIMLLLVIGICLFSIASKVSAMYISGSTTLEKGDTITLAVYDEEGNKVACHWTSKDSEKASVINGRVTGKKAGSATIVAKSFENGEECSITITVVDNGNNDEIETDSEEIDIAGTISAVAQLTGFIIEIIESLLGLIIPLLTGLAM